MLRPNLSTHSVTLVRQYTNPSKTLLAESQGNMLSLPGGNWLLGYGRLPNFTEYQRLGHVLFDATLGQNVQTSGPTSRPGAPRPRALLRSRRSPRARAR